MNKQEIFSVVRSHLIAQSARCEDPDTGCCQYYGPGDMRCAVGALIYSEAYDPAMEDSTVHVLITRLEAPEQYYEMLKNDASALSKRTEALSSALVASGIDVTDLDVLRLLNALQSVHDNTPVARWSEALNRVAIDHGLQP